MSELAYTNRFILIMRILKVGEEIEVVAFHNDKETSGPSWSGRAVVSAKEIEMLCEDINTALSRMAQADPSSPKLLTDVQRAGKSLFGIIFDAETKNRLKDKEINYLVLSIDEQLMHIPWELLHDGEDFLCLRYAMGRITGPRQGNFEVSHRSERKVLNALVITPSSELLGLTYNEGIEVSNKLFLRRGAIRTSLKVMDIDLKFVNENIQKSDIIHFLGYIKYDIYDQYKTGWIFKDGILAVEQIRSLGAKGYSSSFVFSNATQYGKQEEWPLKSACKNDNFAMANAFLLAGTKHYIGTFWGIPKEARLLFVKEFYSLAADGAPIGEALRLARLKLVEAYGRLSLFWSVYFLYGNPAISFFEEEAAPSARAEADSVVKWQARSFLLSRNETKKLIVAVCLLVGIVFAAKTIYGLFGTFGLLNPDLKAGLSHILSLQKESVKLPQEAASGAIDLATVNVNKRNASQPAESNIYDDIGLLQEKIYFNILATTMLKNLSNPGIAIEKSSSGSGYRKYSTKSRIYFAKREYENAAACALRTLTIAKESGNLQDISVSAGFLAYANARQNNFVQAVKVISENEEAFERAGYKRGIADGCFRAGLLYTFSKNFNAEKIVSNLRKAANIYASINDGPDTVMARIFLGHFYFLVNSYDKAVNNLLDALEISMRIGDNPGKGLAYKALAGGLMKNSPKASEKFYDRALFLNIKSNNLMNRFACLDTFYTRAFSSLRSKNYNGAESYRKKINIFTANKDKHKYAEPYSDISSILQFFIRNQDITAKGMDVVYYDIASGYFEIGYYNSASYFVDRGIECKTK